MDIFQKVQQIISERLEVEPEDVSPDIPLFQACRMVCSSSGIAPDTYICFGEKWKSINIYHVVEIVLIIEEEFGIHIPDSDMYFDLTTIKELVDCISSKAVNLAN